jgi:DNA-binding CsgD family transcriptional regulator
MNNKQAAGLIKTKLLPIIDEIYDAVYSNEWSSVLDQIIAITHSNKALFFMRDVNEAETIMFQLCSSFEYDKKLYEGYRKQPIKCPIYIDTKEFSEGEVRHNVLINTQIDLSNYIGVEYSKSHFFPMPSYYYIGGILIRDGKYDSILGLTKAIDSSPFSEDDINFISILTPHFCRAMSIFKSLKLYKKQNSLYQCFLNQQDKGLLICDKQQHIFLMNKYALDKFDRSSFISISNHRLVINHPIYNQMLVNYIENSVNHEYFSISQQKVIVLSEQGENIFINVLPIKNKNNFSDIDVPCCLITIIFEKQLNWEAIISEFELTPKESQLLKALYQKQKINDLTHQFDVSYNTLRTHLQSIFHKMSVNSQTDLMIKLSLFK